jgi:CubicO group peptidase (beta-lactamase class C family)
MAIRKILNASVVLSLAISLASAQQPAFETATPESQGITTAAVAELSDLAAGFVDKDFTVGSELLIIKNRKIIFHEAYGFADREDKRPWSIDAEQGTICNIRSMTKTLTGAAAQILIDRGQLHESDPVAQYLEGFDNDKSRMITVEQVLTHRSGLPLTILTAIDEYPDLIAQANAAGERGPEFEPGSKFWYSDIGTDVVAAIIEVISGETIDAFVGHELLEPLGMHDSFYGIDATDPRFSRIGSLYVGGANAWVRFWKSGDDPFYPFAWGSQTLYSTPIDYAKFLAMWMDGGMAGERRVLSEDAIRRTLTPASPMSMLGSDSRFPTDYRDLGVYYGQMSVLYCKEDAQTHTPIGKPEIISHSGSDGTIAWAWPELDLMVLFYTQSRGGSAVLRLESAIDRLLVHPGEAAEVVEIPEEFKPYIGIYIANFAAFENEEFTVLYKKGTLALDIPSQMVYELLEPDEDGAWPFAIAPDQVKVTFELAEDGTASKLQLHQAGAVFDVPRKGTAEAEAQSKPIVIDPAILESLVGKYHDATEDRVIEVFLNDDGVLSVKAPPNIVLQLRPVRDREMTWLVKQSPAISLSFETDDTGVVISMTRHIGERTLVMLRQAETNPADKTDPESSDPE